MPTEEVKSLLEETRVLDEKYDQLSRLLSYPEILADAKYMRFLVQEQTTLKPIHGARQRLLKLVEDGDFCLEELKNNGKDRKFYEAELAEINEKIISVCEEIKKLLADGGEIDLNGCTIELSGDARGVAILKETYIDLAESIRCGISVDKNVLTVGDGGYGAFKSQGGRHKFVFTDDGKQNSCEVLVIVLPKTEVKKVTWSEKDLRIDIYHSSGAGGQNVNKVASAVRITHLPTGIAVSCQEERSQLFNKERAFTMLEKKLAERNEKEVAQRTEELRRQQIKANGYVETHKITQ